VTAAAKKRQTHKSQNPKQKTTPPNPKTHPRRANNAGKPAEGPTEACALEAAERRRRDTPTGRTAVRVRNFHWKLELSLSLSLSRWLQDFQHFQSFCECVGVLRLNEAPKKFGIIVLPKNLDL